MIIFAVTKNKINMKTLPKFFAIKRDANNPLWMDYITWLNRTYDKSFSGDSNDDYYGFDGKADFWYCLFNFDEPVEVITLEQWNECVSNIPMKKTIKEWLQELPEGYRERALKNLECVSSNKIVDTMVAAIGNAFTWINTEEGSEFWCDVHHHYCTGGTLPELPKDEQTGKLIGYKLTGKVSPEQAGAFFKCDANVYSDGTFLKVAHEGVIRKAKEAGVFDIWFEPVFAKPVFAKPAIIHSVGGKFNVTIKEGKIYHGGSNITEYVKEVKEFADSLPNKIKGFNFDIKDIILRQTGCERKETSIKDWVELYGVWSKNQ